MDKLRKAAPVIVLVVALCIACLGFAFGSAGILVGLLSQEGAGLLIVTMSASFMALTVVLGLGLAWQARQALQGHVSSAFAPRRIWLWAVLFLLLVAAGQIALDSGQVALVAFPFIHIAAGTLPPVLILAMAGRGLGLVTRNRDVVLEVSSGAFLSTFLAVCLEAVLLLVLVAIVLAAMSLQSDGLAPVQALLEQFSASDSMPDSSSLRTLVESPVVIAAILLAVALVVPLVEEAVKTVGVGLRMYTQPTLSEALLWGIACGAGFALVEGLLNTVAGLDAWAAVVLLRVGATLLHCFTGGLMGLAWYALLRRRRLWWALGLFLLSVGIHGLWNYLSVSIPLGSWQAADASAESGFGLGLGPAQAATSFMLVILTVAVGIALVGLVHYARLQGEEPDGPDDEAAVSASDMPPAELPAVGDSSPRQGT